MISPVAGDGMRLRADVVTLGINIPRSVALTSSMAELSGEEPSVFTASWLTGQLGETGAYRPMWLMLQESQSEMSRHQFVRRFVLYGMKA